MTDGNLLITFQELSKKLAKGKTPQLLEKLQELKIQNEAVIDALAPISDMFKRQRAIYEDRLEALCALRSLIDKELNIEGEKNEISGEV